MSSLTPILGLHHISIVSANAQRTIDFYTTVLGLRFIKKTVNFDDPERYHLYSGGEVGHQLKLPPWLESNRRNIEPILRPVIVPGWLSVEVSE